MTYLSTRQPSILNFADINPELFNDYLRHLQFDIAPRTGAPLSINARRARAGTVAKFLSDGAAWDWPNFPTRPILDPNDLPKLAHRVPRFIPVFLGGKLVANGEAEYQETDVVIEAWRFPI